MKSLEGTTATRRHIILFTDGWSTSGAYSQIIARMKAAGITLSTIGAGGGSAPILAQLAKQGGGRYYPAPNPASIPDIFLKETQQVAGQQIVEEPFHPIQTSYSPILRGLDDGLPDPPRLQRARRPSRRPRRCSSRPATTRSSPSGSTDSAARWPGPRTRPATGRRTGSAGPGSRGSSASSSSWTFPGEETGGIEARFDTQGGKTTLHVESVGADGSPRDFYATTATIVGPSLTPIQATLPQIAPGVYETTLGEIDPGAYAIRLTQTKPGSSALGRTVGLVAPTAAEYRTLGPNEPLLAAIRSATGGRVADDPVAVWRHDLASTSTFTDLWPALLVLAMLLWPLDIALRRVSIGRRELASARAWVRGLPARRRRAAPRTADVEVLIAARERSTGMRAALRQGPGRAAPAETPVVAGPAPDRGSAPTPLPTAPGAPAAAVGDPAAPRDRPAPAKPGPAPAAGPEATDEMMARLREAKRRTRER